jgi:hypothetical protein
MSSVPPGLSPLRLPLGNIVYYPTGRPSIRVLAREIAALGYKVSVFPLSRTDLRLLLAPGVWHNSVVIGDIIIFIVTPTAPSAFRDSSASDLSVNKSLHHGPDSDNFDPDSVQAASSSDQSGYESDHNEFDSDNVDPDFPELGYQRA